MYWMMDGLHGGSGFSLHLICGMGL